jgi:hypothetical protein
MSTTTPWFHRLGALLALALLVGLAACGSPSPDAPRSSHAIGSAGAVGSPQRLTQPASAPPGQLSTEAPRVTTSAPNAASPDEQIIADQAQRQAWDNWYAAAREHPDVGVRLMALEHWAQQPSETIDPVTAALVDEDEEVRTRAEELYDQHLTREATRAQPVQEEGQKGGTTP